MYLLRYFIIGGKNLEMLKSLITFAYKTKRVYIVTRSDTYEH